MVNKETIAAGCSNYQRFGGRDLGPLSISKPEAVASLDTLQNNCVFGLPWYIHTYLYIVNDLVGHSAYTPDKHRVLNA